MASSAAGRNDPAPIIVKKVTVVEAGPCTVMQFFWDKLVRELEREP